MAILEEETFEKFGYYPKALAPYTTKKILVKCNNCGKIRRVERRAYRDLCHLCAMAELKHRDTRVCKYCGKPFLVIPSQVKRGRGVFCSRKCMGKWQSEHRRGENSPTWAGGNIERICEFCGKIFSVPPHKIKPPNSGKFCSLSCWAKSRHKYLKIPNHHTKPELIFEEICKKNNLPFKYTGDGSFWIGKDPSINPDFVECNGKKIAVEIFGDYWHSPLQRYNTPLSQTYKGKKNILKKYGWRLIVFWESDLKREDAEQFVLNTLKKNEI